MGQRQRSTIIEAEQPVSRRTSEANSKLILEAINRGIIIPKPHEGKVYIRSGKEIAEQKSFFGYRVCRFRIDNKIISAYIHKIIWLSVHGKITQNFEIDHINGDKEDCRITELQELFWKKNIQKGQLKKEQLFGAF